MNLRNLAITGVIILALLAGYAALAGALDGGTLPARLKEQIALLAAATNACDSRIGAW